MRRIIAVFLCVTAVCVWAAARGVRNLGVDAYPNEVEHPEAAPLPDGDEKTEFAFARLRYPMLWRGMPPGSGPYLYWGMDAPKAERQFMLGVRRLSRIHARSVEEVVNFDGDQIFDFPWLYAVEVGHWSLNDRQVKKLREYLLKGGFLMTDDFHGTAEWRDFSETLEKVFPGRPVVDIAPSDPIFHVLYDLDKKIQVPGKIYFVTGREYERDGIDPKWRGVYDDKGRLMMGICFNQDNGDAWEWADDPHYKEHWASQAYRLGLNYIIYAMTH